MSAVFVYQCPDEMIIYGDFRYLFASRSASFLINPYIIDTKEKKDKIYRLMRINKNDFLWDESVIVNFDVDEKHLNRKIIEQLGEVVQKNALT